MKDILLQMPVRQFGEECFIAQFDIEKFFQRIPTSLLFDTIGTLIVKYNGEKSNDLQYNNYKEVNQNGLWFK